MISEDDKETETNIGFPYIRIDLDQVKENLFALCGKTRKDVSQVIAVVKDNSYGLGAGAISKLLQDAGVKYFAVATIDEAAFLRRQNIRGDILVLGNVAESDFATAENLNLTLSAVDKIQLKKIKKAQNIKWHICVDTGMRRDGIMSEDIQNDGEILRELKEISSVISGIYTHYHSSDDKIQDSVSEQQNKFAAAVSTLQNAGLNFEVIHTSNSGACAYSKIAENEFIRPGVLLYGCRPDPARELGIGTNASHCVREAAKIYSKVSGIRKIKKGEGVSYGHTWQSQKDSQIATVAIGYADGFPRTALGASFEFEGKAGVKTFPLVGRVTMDYIMLDIGDDTEIKIGDTVALAGTIDELAIKSGTIGYELLCKFGGLMNRKYISDGKTAEVSVRELY